MNFSRIALVLATFSVMLVGALALPQAGSAHLDLVDSTPADGASLSSPVERVVLRFTVPGEPAGPGIRILDGQGTALPAVAGRSGDRTTFVVRPRSPLAEGRYGVAWRVAAPDAHPISGGFTFTVAAAEAGGGASAPVPAAGTIDLEGTAARAPALDDDPLAQAIASPDDRGAKLLAGVGRALAYGGGLFAIGGLVFLAFAAVGSRRELTRLFGALRAAGLVVLVGGLVGIVARAWLIDGGGPDAIASTASLGDALEGDAGVALVLTALGGLLVALGARAAYAPPPEVAIAAGSWDEYRPHRVVGGSIRNAWIAVGGVVAIAVGAAFDGHTASEGPRVVVWAADFVHIAAAGVWLGGLALLVSLLVGRRRAGRPANSSYSAVRFATLAGAGSAGAGLAGIALAIIILPSVSALWESTWGLLLVAKVALVAIVAAMGAHNHFRLIPGLADHLAAARTGTPDEPGDPLEQLLEPESAGSVATLVREERVAVATGAADEEISAKLRRNAVVELALLTAVVALTAALVGTSAV